MLEPHPAQESGFTLIELLVVVLIIAILAAVAIPTFLDQRAKAQDSAATSALGTAVTAMGIYNVDHGSYCGASVSALTTIEPTLAQATGLQVTACAGNDSGSYRISDTSVSPATTSYTVSMSGGVSTRTCSTPGKGVCAAAGTW